MTSAVSGSLFVTAAQLVPERLNRRVEIQGLNPDTNSQGSTTHA